MNRYSSNIRTSSGSDAGDHPNVVLELPILRDVLFGSSKNPSHQAIASLQQPIGPGRKSTLVGCHGNAIGLSLVMIYVL